MMKKKMIGMSLMAAALTIATTVSAFATMNSRLPYQNEMKINMDYIYVATGEELIVEGVTENLVQDVTDTDMELTYCFTDKDRGNVLTSTIWHDTNETADDYHTNAYELVYNRCILTDMEAPTFDGAFLQLLQAAMGETVGALVFEDSFNDIYEGTPDASQDDTVEFQKYGATEAGNYYALLYGDGTFTLKITCLADLTEEQLEQLALLQISTDEIVAVVNASNVILAP